MAGTKLVGRELGSGVSNPNPDSGMIGHRFALGFQHRLHSLFDPSGWAERLGCAHVPGGKFKAMTMDSSRVGLGGLTVGASLSRIDTAIPSYPLPNIYDDGPCIDTTRPCDLDYRTLTFLSS